MFQFQSLLQSQFYDFIQIEILNFRANPCRALKSWHALIRPTCLHNRLIDLSPYNKIVRTYALAWVNTWQATIPWSRPTRFSSRYWHRYVTVTQYYVHFIKLSIKNDKSHVQTCSIKVNNFYIVVQFRSTCIIHILLHGGCILSTVSVQWVI